MQFFVRLVAGGPLSVLGVAGVPGDIQSLAGMLAVIDSWTVRAFLVVAGIAIITYPQWAALIKKRFDLQDGLSLWAGLQFRWGWKKAEWEEKWRNRKRRN